ncbi:DNA binding domain, excisionase family [Mycobacteroides abscessus subsp. abscessus]|uniref:helix-turn-helix domain-containing protein n=1 Tax=Mycobacteroides abscessus TaxID=36809 RepID=UPI00092C289B|nr:helix-turn-helix domain-containing protein [Mycobacteroides abscessus]SHP28538.1 DNA binding domain, excisionase family [Mycobacteroides abscessus subsp. abscessus]SHP68570.1 DNA binding domain, excisionase family [Mycobacteroides abscessus subsp. abscessus]SHY39210.1 DNA binding domain, excisionase family [Mycobacteroides abscessus subsp. abscessus]SKD93855.1 DNA binding domain, excisionase family [Mycobacteroides abscessus subsp. abscessus]
MTAYDPAAEALRARFRREEAELHDEGYLTIDDAAALLGVRRNTVSKMIADGRLRAVRVDDRTVTRAEWVAQAHRGHRPRRRVPDGLITAAEAADRVGVHAMTIRRAIRAGHLPATTKSGGYVISPADLDAWAPRRNPAVAWRREHGWLSVAEAAALLGISRPALNIRIQQGRQSAVRAGADAPIPGAWLIRAEDVRAKVA